jgi:hypothetical protein
MDVIDAGLVGMAVQLVAGLLLWWLRLRWQHRTERMRNQTVVELVTRLGPSGGRVRDQRADGSVTELVVEAHDGR